MINGNITEFLKCYSIIMPFCSAIGKNSSGGYISIDGFKKSVLVIALIIAVDVVLLSSTNAMFVKSLY